MKIILHSLQDLLDLTALIRGGSASTTVGELKYEVKIDTAGAADAIAELGEAIRTKGGTEPSAVTAVRERENTPLAEPTTDGPLPQADRDGVPHDTDWHSDPAKINADGRWRARRKRDEDAYAAWVPSHQLVIDESQGEPDPETDEPVVTETHALPQDEPADAAEPAAGPTAPESLPSVDMAALVEACRGELEGNASDSAIELLNTARDFIGQHGTAVMEALKAAAVPDEAGKGKAIPLLAPGERRLLRACLDNYGL